MNIKKLSMYKRIILILILGILSQSVFGQISDLKKKSEKQKNKNNQNKNKGYRYDNSNSNDSDPCVGAAATACFDIFFSAFFSILMRHHDYVMNNLQNHQTALSLEIKPHFAYGTHFSDSKANNYLDFLPEIKGTFGVFELDYRYNFLAEYKDYSVDAFQTWDLIFNINIYPVNNTKLSIGTGIQYHTHTKDVYSEHFLFFEVASSSRKIVASIECRSAWDYENSDNVYFQIGPSLNYKFVEFKNFYAYLSGGFMYQNYFTSHDIWLATFGITFNLH